MKYARKYGLLKEKDKNLEGNDVREGLFGNYFQLKYLNIIYSLKDKQNLN